MINDYTQRSKDPKVWKPYDDYYRPLIYNQLAAAFEITPDQVDFSIASTLQDILWSENFQGLPSRYNFTKEEFEIVKSIQFIALVELLGSTSRSIMVSRMVNPVVEMMKSKLGMPYNASAVSDFETAKFLLFSSHDYQLSHILAFLNPENLDLKGKTTTFKPGQYIDYASVVLYELHEKESLLCKFWKKESCYIVKVFFNNIQLKLPGCKTADCTFKEFSNYIAKIGMTYDQMAKQCAKNADMLTQSDYDAFINSKKIYS